MTTKGKDIKYAIFVDTPCHGCKDRHAGCHSSCKKYEEYRTKLDEYNEKHRKQLNSIYHK